MNEEEIAAAAAAEQAAAEAAAAEPANGDPSKGKDPKADARTAYDQRKAQRELEELRKENEGYKRRDEEKRKSELSEQQRLQEERDKAVQEADSLRSERMKDKIAQEFKLPPVLAARLIGTDEESLRADAEELMKSIPKAVAGSPTNPVREQGTQRIYTRAELAANPKLARSPEVIQAAREGRVR